MFNVAGLWVNRVTRSTYYKMTRQGARGLFGLSSHALQGGGKTRRVAAQEVGDGMEARPPPVLTAPDAQPHQRQYADLSGHLRPPPRGWTRGYRPPQTHGSPGTVKPTHTWHWFRSLLLHPRQGEWSSRYLANVYPQVRGI